MVTWDQYFHVLSMGASILVCSIEGAVHQRVCRVCKIRVVRSVKRLLFILFHFNFQFLLAAPSSPLEKRLRIQYNVESLLEIVHGDGHATTRLYSALPKKGDTYVRGQICFRCLNSPVDLLNVYQNKNTTFRNGNSFYFKLSTEKP